MTNEKFTSANGHPIASHITDADPNAFIAEVSDNKAALDAAIKALETLPEETFGYVENYDNEPPVVWSIRNELVDNLKRAALQAKVPEDMIVVSKLEWQQLKNIQNAFQGLIELNVTQKQKED